MQTLPKVIIAIPIVIVFLAVFLKIGDNKAEDYTSQILQPLPTQKTVDPISTINSFSGLSGQDKKIDLTGPYVCSYKDQKTDVDLQIENKQIYGKTIKDSKENYLLVKGDCLYTWTKGKNTGLKVCQIGQYLSIFEMASSFMSSDTLFSSMLSMVPNLNISEDSVVALVNSCEKKEVEKTNFVIPKGVIFKTATVDQMGGQFNNIAK